MSSICLSELDSLTKPIDAIYPEKEKQITVCVWQLDCGIHPGLEGMDALPYIDLIDPAEIDLLLISQ